jgi:tRNA(Ser,Leu) C12 N-acetylase TAN1
MVRGLENWNVLATAKDMEQRRLAGLLQRFGKFRRTRFLGVLVGRVKEPEAFFEELRRREEEEPGFLDPLSKLVPIDRTFGFTVETFAERLKEAVLPYAELIGNGSFYLRVERRGHAGEIHSQHVEQELDGTLRERLVARGQTPSVDFNDPDVILVAETLDDECGVGAIPRSMRTRFPFVRVP